MVLTRAERSRMRTEADLAQHLSEQITQLLRTRDELHREATSAQNELNRRVSRFNFEGDSLALAPLVPTDEALLQILRSQAALPQLDPAMESWLRSIPDSVSRAARDLHAVTGWRRLFVGGAAETKARAAADWMTAFLRHSEAADVPSVLSRTRVPSSPHASLEDSVDQQLGVFAQPDTRSWEFLPMWRVGPLNEAVTLHANSDLESAALVQAAAHAAQALRNSTALKHMSQVPLEQLRNVAAGTLRLGPVHQAGLHTVGDVLTAGAHLSQLPGLSSVSASRIHNAAQALLNASIEDTPTRIDVTDRSPEATALLESIAKWQALQQFARASAVHADLLAQLSPIVSAFDNGAAAVAIGTPSADSLARLRATIADTDKRVRQYRSAGSATGDAVWSEYAKRPADFHSAFSALGLTSEDRARVEGGLPAPLAGTVQGVDLRGDALLCTLRGYQSFGARFAIAQRRVIIGDEMGLGKTVEALAVMAHLWATGRRRFLVICPAAVLTNWLRETQAKTRMPAFRLHGPSRDQEALQWTRIGGVAVTTYETLGWLHRNVDATALDCVIADEAHAIKNPQAQRSQRAAALIEPTPFVVLMTGTPLENRLSEFQQLVRYVRPDLTSAPAGTTPRRFRKQVAPAYLRRNQEDVLAELPERTEIQEWLPFSAGDDAAYRDAVAAGNFMRMRQAAMLSPDSAKLGRLHELVAEAVESGRKVLVFSYFLQVLQTVAGTLPGTVIGPLTGAVTATGRQDMIDRFTQHNGGCVLVAQIQAGGVGLNIQAASVVILTEPQWKPATEEQAIARAHRMGQLQKVQVHRLLSESGVDARMVELLKEKQRLFADYARVSDAAASDPAAYDVGEAQLSRQILQEERERLFDNIRLPGEPRPSPDPDLRPGEPAH